MTTKTGNAAAAQKHLEEAEQRRDEVLRRIGNGDAKVTAKQLSDAEDGVRLAELRMEAAHDADREAAEASRQQRITEIRDELTSQRPKELLREALAAKDKAANALTELRETAGAYHRYLSTHARTLRGLGELPDDLLVESKRIVADGIPFEFPTQLPDWLEAEAKGERKWAGDRPYSERLAATLDIEPGIHKTRPPTWRVAIEQARQVATDPQRFVVKNLKKRDTAQRLSHKGGYLADDNDEPRRAGRVTVKLSQRAPGRARHRMGAVVTYAKASADWLIEHGYAEPYEEPQPDPVAVQEVDLPAGSSLREGERPKKASTHKHDPEATDDGQ